MAEKIFVTNYDRDEIIAMIREAFNQELKAISEEQNKKKDWDHLLTRKEAAEMLRISLVTLNRYQKEGILPYAKIGRHVYIKKGAIMEAIENRMVEKHRKWGNFM
jgi:excisionase family DNA binding protein